MVRYVSHAARAPVQVIGVLRPVNRSVTFVALTGAVSTSAFPTAIIVGNDIIFAVGWVAAGTYPGDI